MKRLHIAQVGYVAISFLFYIAAILSLLFTGIPAPIFSILSGIVLLVYGVIKIIGYFSEDLFCLAFRYDLAFGILLIVIGVIVLFRFAEAVPWLPLGVGWLALLDCVMKVQMAQEARQFGLEHWQVILITAMIAGAFGVILIIRCIAWGSGERILTALTLLSVGAMNHYSAVAAVGKAKGQSKNIEL